MHTEDGHQEAKERGLGRDNPVDPDLGPLASRTYKKINFYSLRLPVCGLL